MSYRDGYKTYLNVHCNLSVADVNFMLKYFCVLWYHNNHIYLFNRVYPLFVSYLIFFYNCNMCTIVSLNKLSD